ncbi:MAG: Recombination protein MgsA, partial [Pseudarthrobacter sp.]|nr:Recombination protein MgsA [Pseudarthrobacter sp.]
MDDLFAQGPGNDDDGEGDSGAQVTAGTGTDGTARPRSPLAVRMRPRTLDDVV